MIIKSEADIRNARLAFRNNSKGSVMSPAEIVLFPLACTLVFVIGYSLVLGRLSLWPFFPCVASIFVGWTTGSEHWSVYVYIGLMFALRALASLGNAALDRASVQMEV